MKYVKLGNSGLDVSRICLGGMSFGDPTNWMHKWLLNEDQSRPIIKRALDLGINFFDTANIYALGESERVMGKILKEYANRDEIVLGTKVAGKMSDGPNGSGLSRKAIMTQIDQSLERLQTDYVDLYIIHRWDYETPIEETMEALHDVVKSGKARYIGASAMYTHQFQKAQHVAEKNNWTQFISMQNHMNLIYREEEREMIPYCQSEGIALTPYSPLAAGRLTRDLSTETHRSQTDESARSKYDGDIEKDLAIINRVRELADKYEVSQAQISLAWLLQIDGLAAPVVGSTKIKHVEDAVKAVDLILTKEDISYLEEPYTPRGIIGFS